MLKKKQVGLFLKSICVRLQWGWNCCLSNLKCHREFIARAILPHTDLADIRLEGHASCYRMTSSKVRHCTIVCNSFPTDFSDLYLFGCINWMSLSRCVRKMFTTITDFSNGFGADRKLTSYFVYELLLSLDAHDHVDDYSGTLGNKLQLTTTV